MALRSRWGAFFVSAISTSSWNSLLERLQARIPPESYSTWFKRLSFLKWDGGCLRLLAPNRYVKDWIESHYRSELLEAARSIIPETISAELQLPSATAPSLPAGSELPKSLSAWTTSPSLSAVPAPAPARVPASASETFRPAHAAVEASRTGTPEILGSQLQYRFDSFVVGACNRLAHAACQQVVEAPATAYNPLVLYGDHGLGKTHLLQAVAQALQGRFPNPRVRMVSCEEFANGFVYSLQARRIEAFRSEYRRCHALLVDDLQFLGGKEKTQDEFLHTLDHLRHQGRQLVFSCHVHPREIKNLDGRLAERLQSGLVARLAPPCFETRVELLRSKAQVRGLPLAPALTEILALRVERSVRELEGVVCKLAALVAAERRPADKEMALLALRELGYLREGPLTLEDILAGVVQRYGQDGDQIRSAKRHAELVRPRHMAMYLAKQLTTLSLGEIGRFFGNRDHSTVLHATRKLAERLKLDEELRAEVQALRRALGR